MINCIKNELYKSFSQIKIFVFLLAVAAAPLVFGIGILFVRTQLTDPAQVEMFSYTGMQFPLEILSGLAELLIPVFIVILISDKFTEEYKQGTLKLPLITPVSRKKILFSKIISVGIEITILLVILFGSSYIFGNILFGFQSDFTYGMMSFTIFDGIIITILSYMLTGIILFVFSLIITVLAIILKSTGSLIGIAVGMILSMQIISLLGETISKLLLPNYFKFYISLFYPMDTKDLITSTSIIIIYGIIGLSLSVTLFKKKDMNY